MTDRRTVALATVATAGALGLAFCIKALVSIQAERRAEREDGEARAKAVAELSKKFETMLEEKKKITPALDIKLRDTSIGHPDFPVEKDLFELVAAATQLAKPTAPQQTRRPRAAPAAAGTPAADAPSGFDHEAIPDSKGRFATLARAVRSIVGLRATPGAPFETAPWEEEASLTEFARLAAALVPLAETSECKGAYDAAAKAELLAALRAITK